MNNNQEGHETVNKQEDDQHYQDMVIPESWLRQTVEDLDKFRRVRILDLYRRWELPAGIRIGRASDWNKSFQSPTVVVPYECKSLAATTIEMLDNGFYKSYDEHPCYRPSNTIIGYPHSHAEVSSSHSEVPQVINIPPLKNDVSIHISERGKDLHKGGELDRKKPDHISDGLNEIHSYGINSPKGEYVSIDIPRVVNKQWKEYIGGELERNKRDYSKIYEYTLAIAGQAVGSWLSSKFSGSSPTSWTENFLAVATIFGIAFTLSGIGLSRVNPRLSGITIKLGAVATTSAIILALGSTVVPAVAWTAGAVAGFLIAVGVIMA